MAGRHRRAHASNPRRAVATLLTAVAIAAAWVAVGVTGTGGTFAAWSSSITVPGTTLHTGSAALQLASFEKLGTAFQAGALTTGPDQVTITNTGTATLRGFSAQASVSGNGASTLATALTLTIWPVANGAACGTAPRTAITGKWSAMPNWLANQGALAVGDTATYCVTTSTTHAALTQYPSRTVTPAVTVTGTTRTDGGWSTGAQAAATFSFSTPAPWTTVSNPSQYGISGGNGTSIAVKSQPQTIDGHGYLCFDITATYGYGYGGYGPGYGYGYGWQVLINTSKAPFRGVAVNDWVWPAGSAAAAGVRVAQSYGSLTLTDTNYYDYGPQEFQLCVPTGN